MKRRAGRPESGYTLIELIISLTLLATITGALVAAFLTTNNANANVSERIHESNDAQIIAGFWTADAQAAGGVDPALGATDTDLGVSKTDDGWLRRSAAAARHPLQMEGVGRAANSTTTATPTPHGSRTTCTDSSTAELERRTCANGTSTACRHVGQPRRLGADGHVRRERELPGAACRPSASP